MFRSIAVVTLIRCGSAHGAALPTYNVSACCKTQADYNGCIKYEMQANAVVIGRLRPVHRMIVETTPHI
jgi:hypothetical protein